RGPARCRGHPRGAGRPRRRGGPRAALGRRRPHGARRRARRGGGDHAGVGGRRARRPHGAWCPPGAAPHPRGRDALGRVRERRRGRLPPSHRQGVARLNMRIALVIAAKDLRQRLRDRSALVVGVAAPLMLAVIISAALGGTGFNSFHATYALYDGDHGPVARSFTAIFGTPQLRRAVRIRTVRSAAEAASLTKHDLAAAFVIPPGFSGSVTAGDRAAVRVIRSRADLIGGQV